MTYEEREAIFSKEALNNEDIQKLFGVCRTEATNIMNTIRRQTGDRLKVQGKIHIEDYLKHFGIEANRYSSKRVGDLEEVDASIKLKAEKTESRPTVPLIRSKNYM